MTQPIEAREIVAQFLICTAIVALLATARRWHFDLVSPPLSFAIVWLAALLGATFPPFGTNGWSPQVWLVLLAAPTCLVLGSAIGSRRSPISRRPIRLQDLSRPSERIARLLLLATLFGGTVFLIEFWVAGGVPLFSGRADELRMHLVFNPFLHLATRLVPVSVVLSLMLVPKARGAGRWILVTAIAFGASFLAMQAARLEVVTVAGIFGIAAFMIYGVSRRALIGLGALALLLLGFVSSVFLFRLPQHPSTAFEYALLDDVVPSRGPLLSWTVPVQVGVSSGAWVMARLVITDALATTPGNGLYMWHGYDRFLPARDSSAVAAAVTAPLIAPTYLADPYGDFGLAGAALFSLAVGLIAGAAYRRAVHRARLFDVLLYAYVAYWMLFGIYVNIWTYYGFWTVDIALLWIGCRLITGQTDLRTSIYASTARRLASGRGRIGSIGAPKDDHRSPAMRWEDQVL